ncbi:multidrug resistance protein [Cedecea lapagei]|uniref:Multidrug resistance protein n=1 Tax=Cedecea lapagei TaxID=158823 RepID=A0A3S4IEY1_9ENTR|nr:MFS transporter [Cedecea lapagei]VEB98641.1 multidrug resistance protein [Cedecea lapagei]
MIQAYRQLFAASGTRGFALAGLLARLPLPMIGIGIITLLSQLHGSFTLAGAVAATFVLTYALLSPQTSRLVDRFGQSRILPLASGIALVGMLLLLTASHWRLPDATLFLGALLIGFMPSMSAMVRARWSAIYRGEPQIQTAYSLEAVFDEVTFIVGPPLSVGLCVAVFPQAGLIAAALFLAVGVGTFVMQRKSEPPLEVLLPEQTRGTAVIRLANVRLLSLLMIAMGIIVGTVDIVSVAFANALGKPAAASLVLSAYAFASCLAGLLFGALKLRVPLYKLLLLGGFATAVTTLPLLMVSGVTSLTAAVLFAGLFFSPTMIVAMSLVEQIVPERSLTEGLTWLLSGLNVGVAIGAAVSGMVVDSYGAKAGFCVALSAGSGVLIVAYWAYRKLRS